ncbi:MAG: ATP-binding protein [bacterium]|nr:ATP-binding protein [bacterium]
MLGYRLHRRLSDAILKAFQVSSDPEVQLSRTARVLAHGLGADLCLLCVRGSDLRTILLRGIYAGEEMPMSAPGPETEAYLLDILTGGKPVLWSSREGKPGPLPGPLEGGLASALVFPVTWRQSPVALAVIGYSSRRAVPRRVVGALNSLSDTLAAMVRGSVVRMYQTRKNEMAGELLRVSEHLGAAADVQGCLARIARAGSDLTGSTGAVLRIVAGDRLTVKAFFAGELPALSTIHIPNDLAFAEKALETGRSVMVNRTGFDPGQADRPVSRNMLCVPFGEDEGFKGVLTVFDRGRQGAYLPYGRVERETVKALTRLGITAVSQIGKEHEVRRISRSLERRVRELTLLHQISRAVLEKEEVNEVLRSLLEAVTNLRGFGFDRAFLFLLNPEKKVLNGLVGREVYEIPAGPEARPEAREIAGEEGESPAGTTGHRELDELISGFSIPVKREGGVLPLTVMEKRSYRIRLPMDRDLISEEVVTHLGGVDSFATVPLVSEGRVLGVIWVDNLHTRRPIGKEDFQLLISAAAQAGLAVERSLQAEALSLLNSQLMDLQNRMIQWEKMAALGEMAASVAHDIRNPLVSIGGFTRRLRKLITDEERGLKYVDIIIREVDRLEQTLDNVMSYSRSYGAIDRRPVFLYELLAECAELFKEKFRKKKVTLRRQLARDLPELSVDERRIKQAVLNLLFNAGESAASQSEVRFTAQVRDTGPDSGVIISVSDNGCGIDPADLGHIFEPFFTTKGAGTGLGLAIAQRAVSGHGGEIRVDNRHGEGVTFTIRLPI